MEEHHSPRKLAEQPQVFQNGPTATTQINQSTQSSDSEGSAIVYPSMDPPLLPQDPTSQNSMGERARGEPAILISPPIQDSALAICQHIVGLLRQITEHRKYCLYQQSILSSTCAFPF